jgi:hypothetical protein
MFYKIDPVRRQMQFDLGDDGFRVGDRLWIALRGDFQPTPSVGVGDTFQNTSVLLGPDTIEGPGTVEARDTLLVALNRDRPLTDNTDPDNDYGILVQLAAFTARADVFDFSSRTALPDVRGSIYNAGGGDDRVTMPDAPVAGFNLGRLFRAGPGDDVIRAGDLGFRADLGKGDDTLALRRAEISWGNRENRDNDGLLVLRSGDGVYRVEDAEVLNDRGDRDPLVKWYFKVTRERDGDCTIAFFENGARVARTEGAYDATKAIAGGRYEAILARPDGRGSEEIELLDVAGFDGVSIRAGSGRNPRKDFVADEAFVDAVFDRIADAYELAGGTIPWRKGAATPEVPITVELAGSTARVAAADHADDFLL